MDPGTGNDMEDLIYIVFFLIDLSSTEVTILRGKWITSLWSTYPKKIWTHFYRFMRVLQLPDFSCFRH